MIMDNYQELSQLQEISRKMLNLAEACDWDKLPDLEDERKSLMQSFFSHQISIRDSAQVKQVIQDVLSINDDIAKLAQQEKTSIGHQVQGMKKRQNVHSAYLQNN